MHDAVPEDYKRTHVNRASRVGALLGLTDLQPAAAGVPAPQGHATPQALWMTANHVLHGDLAPG